MGRYVRFARPICDFYTKIETLLTKKLKETIPIPLFWCSLSGKVIPTV